MHLSCGLIFSHVRDHTQQESLRRALEEFHDGTASPRTSNRWPRPQPKTSSLSQQQPSSSWPPQGGSSPQVGLATGGSPKAAAGGVAPWRSHGHRKKAEKDINKAAAVSTAALADEDPYVMLASRGAAFRGN